MCAKFYNCGTLHLKFYNCRTLHFCPQTPPGGTAPGSRVARPTLKKFTGGAGGLPFALWRSLANGNPAKNRVFRPRSGPIWQLLADSCRWRFSSGSHRPNWLLKSKTS